jgi:DNA-binding Xre family transcriptional regulator
MSEHKRTVRQLTAAEKARLATAIEEERQAIPANREQGRRLRSEHEKAVSAAKEVLNLLLAMKEQRHVSLAELETRTGITRGNLSRLWNNSEPNVTLETVERIAAALQCRVRIELESLAESTP